MLLICVLGKMHAQYDAHFTHYWKMLNFYNPAGAGAEQRMFAYAAYSNQSQGRDFASELCDIRTIYAKGTIIITSLGVVNVYVLNGCACANN